MLSWREHLSSRGNLTEVTWAGGGDPMKRSKLKISLWIKSEPKLHVRLGFLKVLKHWYLA